MSIFDSSGTSLSAAFAASGQKVSAAYALDGTLLWQDVLDTNFTGHSVQMALL